MTDPMLKDARPVVKWAGGKNQLIAQLQRQLPERRWVHYHEPFVGGGAFFFHLCRQGRIGEAYLNDVNQELMETYRVIRAEPEALIDALASHAAGHRRHGEAYYYTVRDWDRNRERWQELTAVERAARFIYLNRTCYNGLYRVNGRGQFNVPAGSYENPRIVFPQRIRAAAQAFARARLSHDDFETACLRAQSGDLVYLDPPYAPLSATADFTGYTSDGFDGQDQQRLARAFARLAERGCDVILSNSDTPFVRDLYEELGTLHRVQARRSINTDGDGRGPVNELIVVYAAPRR